MSLKVPSTSELPKLLWYVIALSVLLRLGSAFYQGNEISPRPGVYDQVSYDALSKRVVDGNGFSFGKNWWPHTRKDEPTAHWSFLYTAYLALIYQIFGPNPVAARLFQAVMAGILHPLLVWKLGKLLFNRQIALLAALLSAIYLYFIFYAGALVTETFFILAVLWSLILTVELGSSPSFAMNWTKWILLGTSLGTAVLLRQLILLFVPVLFAWIWWQIRDSKGSVETPQGRNLVGFAIAILVMTAFIMPWTIRNFNAFGRFVLLNTNAGFAFYWGNHPIHGTRFIPIFPSDGPSYQDLIPRDLKGLDEAALDRALLVRGVDFVLEDPVRYCLLSLSRVPVYFKFGWSAESGMISNLSRLGSFFFFLPFILIGSLISICRRSPFNHLRYPEGVMLLGSFVLIYSGIHLLSWALIRYRIPVDAVLLLFGAAGFVYLLNLFTAMFPGVLWPRGLRLLQAFEMRADQ